LATHNLHTAVEAIASLKPFTAGANTLRGVWHTPETYHIYSYRACIGIATVTDEGIEWWVTDTKYSVTTSRHTGVVRRGFHQLETLKETK
jgi:hypothetical protein